MRVPEDNNVVDMNLDRDRKGLYPYPFHNIVCPCPCRKLPPPLPPLPPLDDDDDDDVVVAGGWENTPLGLKCNEKGPTRTYKNGLLQQKVSKLYKSVGIIKMRCVRVVRKTFMSELFGKKEKVCQLDLTRLDWTGLDLPRRSCQSKIDPTLPPHTDLQGVIIYRAQCAVVTVQCVVCSA